MRGVVGRAAWRVGLVALLALSLGASGSSELLGTAQAAEPEVGALPEPRPAERARPPARSVEVDSARSASVPARKARLDARAVQTRLRELTYLPGGAVSGVFDFRTTQAVLALQGRHGLTRDGVVGPQTIAALASAKVPQPSRAGDGRWIEVHRDAGVVLLVEGGKVVRTVHASTGARGYETPAGSYSVFRKERNSWSVPYQVWLPYSSYFDGGIAIHGSDDVPSRPVSHGCVRVPAPEAASVYAFATMGTQVLVS